MRRRCSQFESDTLRQFPRRCRYLIGVSGGRDSVALLDWLLDLGYRDLIVCHIDHQLRGRASGADARFVKKLAARWDLGFDLRLANIRALAKRKKTSIETAAREARYKLFGKIAKKRRCRTIFIAHHADDLVETFLINLLRGAGVTGLTAMREVSTRRIEDINLIIVRPLLSVWRDEIEGYVRERQLKFREDASNRDLALLRNRVRHRVIPYLEKTFGRNIRQSIWRTAIIAAEESTWIESALPDSTDADLAVPGIRALPIALQRRALLKWLRTQNVPDIGFDAIERVRSLADCDTRIAKVNLPGNRHARRRAGKIFIE